LLGVGLVAVLFSVLIFSGKIPIGGSEKSTPKGSVVIWGVVPEEGLSLPLSRFNAEVNTYSAQYVYVSEDKFNQKLLEALASGTGPDMILAPYQIILSQRERIYPFPSASFPEKKFKDTFVDGASILYSPQGALAFPLAVDPMVMFYNRAMLSKHGIVNPPSYWDEVATLTPTLTIKQKVQIDESAIALGSPTSMYTKDILMTIVNQLGQTPVLLGSVSDGNIRTGISIKANTPTTEKGDATVFPLTTALRFITEFSDPTKTLYTWNDTLGRADDRFVAEKLALYIGYESEYRTLKVRNPRAEFEMTYLPQTRNYNTFVTGMRLYGLATLKTSRNPQVALTIQSQFSSGDMAQVLAPLIGGVPALRQYAATSGVDPVIAKSILVARGWYDFYQDESDRLTTVMVSDVVNHRFTVSEASEMFVTRLRDYYSNKNY
jgi:ABC-type glycerol-3-phosphate transport system substrate-binding protein